MKLLLSALLLLVPAAASAHAFGQQYTLPLPTGFYILGGSVVLILSFYATLMFPKRFLEPRTVVPKKLLDARAALWIRQGLFFIASVCVGFTILTGLLGPQGPTDNPAPLFFWIFFLLAFVYISVFVRGLWDAANPFGAALYINPKPAPLTLPRTAHHLPALVLYIFLLWAELLTYGGGARPLYIALGLIGYFVLSQIVIRLYGKEVWAEHFDVFGVFFRMIGFLAPVAVEKGGVYYLPGRIGFASQQKADGVGFVIFILAVLAFTAYDGFRETVPFATVLLDFSPLISPDWFELLAFAIFPAAFFGIYAGAMYFIARVEHTGMSFSNILSAFAYSFVPIAVVYHVAHYFTLIVTETQNAIPLLFGPFGATYTPNPGLIGADKVWYIQVFVIVAGHVLALVISHITTHRLVPNRTQALLAELPLVGVMVLYTAFGLWILSRPFAI